MEELRTTYYPSPEYQLHLQKWESDRSRRIISIIAALACTLATIGILMTRGLSVPIGITLLGASTLCAIRALLYSRQMMPIDPHVWEKEQEQRLLVIASLIANHEIQTKSFFTHPYLFFLSAASLEIKRLSFIPDHLSRTDRQQCEALILRLETLLPSFSHKKDHVMQDAIRALTDECRSFLGKLRYVQQSQTWDGRSSDFLQEENEKWSILICTHFREHLLPALESIMRDLDKIEYTTASASENDISLTKKPFFYLPGGSVPAWQAIATGFKLFCLRQRTTHIQRILSSYFKEDPALAYAEIVLSQILNCEHHTAPLKGSELYRYFYSGVRGPAWHARDLPDFNAPSS